MVCAVARSRVDISAYWPDGETVNAVYARFMNTGLQLSYQTLQKAKDGSLESAKIDNLFKLAAICSELSGQTVSVQDILAVDEE